jgi:hypothetical protein
MSKTISLSLPHDLTQAEARARIEKGVADLRKTFGSRVSEVEERWTENHLDFHVRAAGQEITGRLDVLPQQVNLAVDLPWMLGLLAGKFTQEVEQRGRKLLESK